MDTSSAETLAPSVSDTNNNPSSGRLCPSRPSPVHPLVPELLAADHSSSNNRRSLATIPNRRVSALYEAIHRHDYDSFGVEDDHADSNVDVDGALLMSGTTPSLTDETVVLDLHSASMRRASRDLLSATHMRSRQLFVDLQYHPPSSSKRLLDDDRVDKDGDEEDPDYEDDNGQVDESSSVTFTDTDNEAATSTTSYLESPDVKYVQYGDQPISENIPLLPPLSETTPQTSPTTALKPQSGVLVVLSTLIQQASAIAVVALLSIMISIPFGASYFPIGWRAEGSGTDRDSDATGTVGDGDISGNFPLPGKQALGIRMFLFATIMGQLAFTFSSKFENPVGLQMVENVPFLHALCHIVIQEQGYGMEALSTVCFLFGLSSILVGITFYLLGKWKLGRIVYFFPNHVLVGCIGGIGVFLIITAIEVTSDTTFTFDRNGIVGVLAHWELLSIVVAFELVLRCLQHATKDKYGNAKYPLLSPIYYCMITPLFYLGLALFGVSTQQATDRGFFFPAVEDNSTAQTSSSTTSVWYDPHLWDMFTIVSLTTLSWTAIFQSAGTMIALAAFSLIHVPINIPAFAISTDVDTDMNQELIAHGYANMFSGAFGGLQTYMTYSNSVLYAKSGGKGKISSLLIVAMTMLLFVIGPSIASFLPRCMAGTLLLHIGIDLALEGVYDSFGQYDSLEYAGIWAITLVMTIWGMTAALIAGVIAALTTYAVQSINYQNPIRQIMTASTLRSSAWTRCVRSRAILESEVTGRARILVFQLQGHLFFGNVAQLTDTIKYVLTERRSVNKSPIVVIVDFTLVVGMDSSAAHAVAKLKKIIHRLFHVEISVFVTGSGRGGFPCEYALSEALSSQVVRVKAPVPVEPRASQSGSVSETRRSSSIRTATAANKKPLDGKVFESLDDALRFAEDILIYKTDPSLETSVDRSRLDDEAGVLNLSLTEEMSFAKKYLWELLPMSDDLDKIIHLLLGSMKREEFSKDQALWETGMDSDDMKLLIYGELESIIEDTGASEKVQRGNIVGELGLVHGTQRLTTLVCCSDRAILYSLSRSDFDKLKKRKPQVAAAIDAVTIRYLAHRVQHVNNRYFHTTLPV